MRWPHQSCREMHQSLQVAGGRGGNQGRAGGAPASTPLSPSPGRPPHIEGPDAPDVVHPGMPCPLMGLGQDTEVAPCHSSAGGLGHFPTAHVPLRPQERLHHVLGAAAGTCGWGGWVVSTPRNPSPPHFPGFHPHLQSGTTMGLSSMPRNSPRSFSAASTAFLASNLGRPWMGDRRCHGRARYPAVS